LLPHTSSARQSELINLDGEDEADERGMAGILELATADDRNRAHLEVLIYDRMRIELNGREINSGDRAGTRHGMESLKGMIQQLIKHRAAVLDMAEIVGTLGGLQGEIYNHLHDVYPEKVTISKLSKADMTEIFLGIWKVFNLIWTFHDDVKSQYNPTVLTDLDGYYNMMTALYSRCKIATHAEQHDDSDGQSLKMPPNERFRGYLQDGATLPEEHFRICPCCTESYMHEPPENAAIRIKNAEEKRKWEEDVGKLSKYQKQVANNGVGNKRKKGTAASTPLDRFGKEMTKKVPPPKYEPLLLVCKVATLVDGSAWGWKCPTPGCIHRKCHLCMGMCQFVCSTE